MLGLEGGERVHAYPMKYKTTTITLSSSSLVSLPRLVATSLNATHSRLSVGSSVVLGTWACVSFPNFVVIIIIPHEPASLGCHVAECNKFLLACWVIRGSGSVGMPVIPTCGCWASLRAWLSLLSLLGVRSHPLVLICSVLAIIGRSLSSLHVVIESLGGWHHFGWPGLFVVVWVV